jgi:hypothetical protein
MKFLRSWIEFVIKMNIRFTWVCIHMSSVNAYVHMADGNNPNASHLHLCSNNLLLRLDFFGCSYILWDCE